MLDALLTPDPAGSAGEVTPGSVWAGRIAGTPEGDQVEVVLDGWDSDYVFGPARFQRRTDLQPARDMECLVAFDDDLVPTIVSWGTSVPITVPPGTGDATYVHVQADAQATWVIDHPLPKTPSVTILDDQGRSGRAGVTYPAPGRVVVTFAGAMRGSAILN